MSTYQYNVIRAWLSAIISCGENQIHECNAQVVYERGHMFDKMAEAIQRKIAMLQELQIGLAHEYVSKGGDIKAALQEYREQDWTSKDSIFSLYQSQWQRPSEGHQLTEEQIQHNKERKNTCLFIC